MTLGWKKIRVHLLVLLVLAARAALERFAPANVSGQLVLVSFWLLLGLPLLVFSVFGLFRQRREKPATAAD